MRIVLDVNILASAAGSREGLPFQVFALSLANPHKLVLSEEMIVSLEEVLRRRYFAKAVSDAERTAFLASVQRNNSSVSPDPTVTGVADDAEDDQVLGTAVAGRADIIVTGDKGLLTLGSFVGIPIVTARTFLDLVDA